MAPEPRVETTPADGQAQARGRRGASAAENPQGTASLGGSTPPGSTREQADCGCRVESMVVQGGPPFRILYCPRHSEATAQQRDDLLAALEESMEQLLTLANETYWTLHALPPTDGGTRPRDLDAGLLAKELIDGKRVERARALLPPTAQKERADA